MNICTEMNKRGIKNCELPENDELWNSMKDCYTILGDHSYEPDKEMH